VTHDCSRSQDTGYTNGKAMPITLVNVHGMRVEIATADAYMAMADAAAAAGVNLRINSGFRTNAEQTYFYDCYKNCNCNSCNVAAAPGYSNHQSGHALDLNTATPGVAAWLNANGGRFGFRRTVPSELWHWEWWGGGPGTSYCASCDRSAGGVHVQLRRAEPGQDVREGRRVRG
jgi:D-alanyl-D-alanine carboxypeptidase